MYFRGIGTATPAARYTKAECLAAFENSDWSRCGDRQHLYRLPVLIVAKLFLHHFADADLAGLLRAIAARSDRLFACEPRRAWVALAGSHLLGALGVNAVTRADAVLSVHAGFTGGELSALWPSRSAEWRLHEYPAGLFSHCFRAERVEVV